MNPAEMSSTRLHHNSLVLTPRIHFLVYLAVVAFYVFLAIEQEVKATSLQAD